MYRFQEFYIPDRMMPAIKRYIEEKIAPGDFLTAVIQNNLTEACAMADDENLRNLPAYVAYFYNESPTNCWGSKKKMKAWLESGIIPKDQIEEAKKTVCKHVYQKNSTIPACILCGKIKEVDSNGR